MVRIEYSTLNVLCIVFEVQSFCDILQLSVMQMPFLPSLPSNRNVFICY